MDTVVSSATTKAGLIQSTEPAVHLLEAGYPIALPTETVYGLAADALSVNGVLRIFQCKERPLFDPLIVHIPTIDWLGNLTNIPDEDWPIVEALIGKFWPGPLTIVLPRKPAVPDIVTSGLETVAVRMSAHPVFQHIVTAFGRPVAAPSANRFGRISPTCAADVKEELGGRIHLIVDGGTTQHGIESTIVLVRGKRMHILRSGPVTADDLAKCGEVAPLPPGGKAMAPGQMKSHYAPRTPLTLLPPDALPWWDGPEKAGLLAWCGADNIGAFRNVEILSPAGSLTEAAATLFQKLRRLDSFGLDRIVAESVPEIGVGIAIMDRLRKAASNG
jgi:L-threonylcarbamoyladenylate synthase